MAQSGEHLTFDFGSGHDFRVCETEPCVGLCQRLLGILFPPLKMNKLMEKEEEEEEKDDYYYYYPMNISKHYSGQKIDQHQHQEVPPTPTPAACPYPIITPHPSTRGEHDPDLYHNRFLGFHFTIQICIPK